MQIWPHPLLFQGPRQAVNYAHCQDMPSYLYPCSTICIHLLVHVHHMHTVYILYNYRPQEKDVVLNLNIKHLQIEPKEQMHFVLQAFIAMSTVTGLQEWALQILCGE